MCSVTPEMHKYQVFKERLEQAPIVCRFRLALLSITLRVRFEPILERPSSGETTLGIEPNHFGFADQIQTIWIVVLF